MLTSLLVFLIGCFVLLVVLYVFDLILNRTKLPEDIKHIALAIIGLIGLIALLILAVDIFRNGLPPRIL